MYLTQAVNDVVALDAATGRTFWTYSYRPAPGIRVCCGSVNRGLGILGNTLFLATLDSHLIAIDAKNGQVLWNHPVIPEGDSGYSMTLAPLIIKDKVIVGVAGGEYGIRGFIAAFDPANGKELWRFYTIPGPGEKGNDSWPGDSWKHGAGSIWVTGSYDADLNLTYWGIGNPGPDYNADSRAGDNLYSDSVVALDPDTGKLKWHFQFSPHDEFDYDSTQVPVLADMPWKGSPRKVMLWANRNGFFYVLDRTTGEFLLGKPFTKVTWTSGLDDKGRPVKIPNVSPSTDGTLVYPSVQGGTNWYSPSYSPKTRLFYIPAWEDFASSFVKFPIEFQSGQRYTGGTPRQTGLRRGAISTRGQEDGFGEVRAVDPQTGEAKWEFKMNDLTDSGIMTTASDLLFTGGREGYFFALDAQNGKMLWKATVGGSVTAAPMSYSVGGRQYVGIAAGHSFFTFALRNDIP
jgi:alcohol dehydrogenase (cytochrome c)